MQPLILFAIIGIGTAAMGVGFLAPGFDLTLQTLGAQEELLEKPITSASVDFLLTKIETLKDGTSKTIFVNVIDACSFHSPQDIGTNGVIICKLLDSEGDIVAEGRLNIGKIFTLYFGSDVTFIEIDQVGTFGANDVQNIEKVKIVVLGADPTAQD